MARQKGWRERGAARAPTGPVRVFLALLAAAALLLPQARARAQDPWYEDVHSSFWAYRDIRLMWEEECADGWVCTRWRWTRWGEREDTVAYFYPNDRITRAQYALLMAKTFRLHPSTEGPPIFADVPREFCLYGNKPAYGHIQALAARGWVKGYGEGRFLPHDFIERQHAVAVLVRALGLDSFARAMAPEARRYLDRFPDGYLVDASVAPEMALAIRLGIVIGYDDGRLHPRDHLWRCQAVALMVRSALIDAWADPPRLSPDGDGAEDTASFRFRTLKNRSTRRWSLSIGNIEGQWYRSFYPQGCPGEPPPLLSWDGSDDRGLSLPDGTYFYRAWITDSRGETFRSALKPILLERRRLTGYLHPTEVNPGQEVTVTAFTTGGAQRVVALTRGHTLELSPSRPPGPEGSNRWQGKLAVPAGGEEGTAQVKVVATFPGTTREITLGYYVRDPVGLYGNLHPNPTRAGARVQVSAFTTPNVSRVHAHLPWSDDVTLEPIGGGHWRAFFRTPPDTPDGAYPVLLEAEARGRRKQHPLQLLIEGSTLEDLVITLSD